jgi:Tfp pilus assembly protein PilF
MAIRRPIGARQRHAVVGLMVAGWLTVGGVAVAHAGSVAGDLDKLVEELQVGGRSGYEVFPPLPPSRAIEPREVRRAPMPQSHRTSADKITTRAQQSVATSGNGGAQATPSLIRAVVHKHGGQSGTQALASDLILRGTEALHEGAIERAVRLLVEGVRLDPAQARGHTNLGAAWLRAGHPQEAAASLETAVALDPDQAAAWNNLALAEWRNGSSDLAREHFLRAVAKDPASGSALVNLGLLQSQEGDPEAALFTLRRALTCAYVPAKAHLQLALLLNGAGRVAEAASQLEIYLATAGPNDAALAARLHPHLAAWRAQTTRPPLPAPLASEE